MNWYCDFWGHDWRYNFPFKSQPTKRICSHCYKKQAVKYNADSYLKFEDTVFDENRTDKQLIKKWFKL